MPVNNGVVAVIPARGGSKGVPRKNIRLLGGKPLIAYAIETALACSTIDRVVVSTDDQEIADVALSFGADVPFLRPAVLAGDDSPEWLTWQHAVKELSGSGGRSQIGTFVCVPPTSPLRAPKDVDACVRLLSNSDADVVITITETGRNPRFNMIGLDEGRYAQLLVKDDTSIKRRQDAPPAYDMTTVAYALRPDFLVSCKSIWDGKVKAVMIPPERAVDIDTQLDFEFAEFLLARSGRSSAS